MSNEILISGVDTPEVDEEIRLIEAGLYDLSGEDIEGWFSSIKKVFKKATKPLAKTLGPLVDVAKMATSVPVLSNLIPGKGMIKMGLGLFDDITKLEKHTGKKVKFSNGAAKNIGSAMYLKGYKEGRADEAKEQVMRVKTNGGGSNSGVRRSRNSRSSSSNRFSRRRRG